MSTKTSTGITAQDLHAYFDDELLADQAKTVCEALESDSALQAELEQMRGLRGTVRAGLEAEAAVVPAARFEQIWDEIDRAIERDARLQADADRNASVWTRLWAALRPVRVPVLAAAAAAAVTVLVLNPSADEPNKTEGVASVDQPSQDAEGPAEPEPAPAPAVSPAPEPTKLADANPGVAPPTPSEPESEIIPMPVPENSGAEIHGIEFGGGSGRISNTGTVTVLYVEENAEPINSERSL